MFSKNEKIDSVFLINKETNKDLLKFFYVDKPNLIMYITNKIKKEKLNKLLNLACKKKFIFYFDGNANFYQNDVYLELYETKISFRELFKYIKSENKFFYLKFKVENNHEKIYDFFKKLNLKKTIFFISIIKYGKSLLDEFNTDPIYTLKSLTKTKKLDDHDLMDNNLKLGHYYLSNCKKDNIYKILIHDYGELIKKYSTNFQKEIIETWNENSIVHFVVGYILTKNFSNHNFYYSNHFDYFLKSKL
jgi:hypothetical protein